MRDRMRGASRLATLLLLAWAGRVAAETAPEPTGAGLTALRASTLGGAVPASPLGGASPLTSALTIPPTALAPGSILERRTQARREARPTAETPPMPELFTAERARILLRSLTLPGWGQATVGRRGAAAVFGLAEVGVWASFTAFRIQEQMRRESYERTARLLAGIELRGRDKEFRRIVGSFISSDEYNQLVVYRDAANLYYDDPVKYRQYIAEHQLRGADTWNWDSEGDLLRYRGQQKSAERAALRANGALMVALVNRLVSAVHAARAAHNSRSGEAEGHSWKLEVAPSDPADAMAFRVGVRTRF
jgi:hypothetical protein